MESFKFPLFLLLVVFSSSPMTFGVGGLDEASALLQFKKSSVEMDPEGFLNNWSNSTTPCSWAGVVCSPSENGRVHGLNLSSMRLVGQLSFDSLVSLPNLHEVDLHGNLFYGNIYSSTSLNYSFESLIISSNNFSSRLPSFWTRFPRLKKLSLADNQFTGKIPAEMGLSCRTLVELDLSGNHLVGELPTTFSGCDSLQRLDLGHNQLSGDFIRGVISTSRSLKYLYLPFNNIAGSLPLKALTNCSSLEVIDLGANEFSGEMPTGFGFCKSLPSLRKLLLPDNFISGEIPPELGECTNLKSIDLSFNNLTGTIPPEIWSMKKLSDLVMWANGLAGEIPNDLCTGHNNANFETLILGFNSLSGVVPPSIANCGNLTWVSLSDNKLTGGIPTNIGELKNLTILQLSNNMLSGEIPPDIGHCRSLFWLDLRSNRLTGSIPSSLAAQSRLRIPEIGIARHSAFLGGIIDDVTSCVGYGSLVEIEGIRLKRLMDFPKFHMCQLRCSMNSFNPVGIKDGIVYMDLSYNSLNGTIPVELGQMSSLLILNLRHNQLTGTIPESFRGLTMISVLDLSHNQLNGHIPESLGTLSGLLQLDLSNNNLTGRIPSYGQLLTFSPMQFDNNSGLCGAPPLRACRSVGSTDVQAADERASSVRKSDIIVMLGTFVSGFVTSISIATLVQEVIIYAKNKSAAPVRHRRP